MSNGAGLVNARGGVVAATVGCVDWGGICFACADVMVFESFVCCYCYSSTVVVLFSCAT